MSLEKKTRFKKIISEKQSIIKELQSNNNATKSSNSCRFENCHCCKNTLKDVEFTGKSNIVFKSESKSTNNVNNNDRYNIQVSNKIRNEVNDCEKVMKQNSSSNDKEPNSSIYDYTEEDKVDEFDNTDNNQTCRPCKIVFECPLELLRHRRNCHNFTRPILAQDEIEKYFDCPNRNFCPICKKPIKTRNFRSIFIKHLLTHTIGMTYACRVCKKIFKRRDHMKTHEKRHIVSL